MTLCHISSSRANFFRRHILTVGIGLAVSFNSFAQNWSFSGFGNLGYVYENSDSLGFLGDMTQKADHTTNGSFLPDSRLGVQASYVSDSSWMFTTQYVLEDRAGDEVLDGLKLAFFAYDYDETLNFRLGRIGFDTFLNTDTRSVDFAHTWIRPPMEVYGWAPLPSLDGIDATYRFYYGELDWALTGQFGHTEVATDLVEESSPVRFKGSPAFSVSLSASKPFWTARVSYARLSASSDFPYQVEQLHQALEAVQQSNLGPISEEAVYLYDNLQVSGSTVHYYHAGVEFNDGNWLTSTELVRVKTDRAALANGWAGYLLVGHRFGDFTPYLIGSKFKRANDLIEEQQDWSLVSAELGGLQDTTVLAANSKMIEQQTLSLGMRWDITPTTSLKAQADWTSISDGGFGLWATQTGDDLSAREVQTYSVALSFLF
ncbi:hypothetical protein [Vibrio sp. SCSIO 43136]|uniref:hypothetical protein n=1 Tax=Vibrio sp. SCSIO 43136 TaxID=2819101 RepID=UPI0020761319|nr:hypothetical protein [Vibrio sp. SCSIO 43136]USD65660.1 hypothetical protein J4N39_02155 [Vibrio sp. SCSIO 43136]